MNEKFKNLSKLFQRLPGVGPRQAARFVIALLDQPEEVLKQLGELISNLKKNIGFCNICFNISDNGLCNICRDPKRDSKKIMVIEKATDLESIEKTGLYKGLYHVLGGAINSLEKITPANLKIKELEKRLENMTNAELIIATNPNTPGETTALYLKDLFANKKGIKITRLGRGLASGSNLEYIDEITLKHALEHRK